MPEPTTHSPITWYNRFPPLLGMAVLVLTATPWMSRPVDVPEVSGNVQSQYSLWGMLTAVNSALFGLLVTAIVLIMAFVAAAVLPTRARTLRVVAGWFGAAAIGGIMINIDPDYNPSAGMVLALLLTIGCAVVMTVGAIHEMRQRTLAG